MIPKGPWSEAPKATSFAEREFQVCIAARLVEDRKTYWVAGGGGPMYSVLLAKKLYTPNVIYVAEDGVIGAEPMLPFDPLMTLAAARPSYRALMWSTMNGIGDHCANGYLDYGVLNTLQLDPYGNLNSTWLGAYGVEGRRFNGPGGADTIAAMCRRVVLMLDHQRRKFVPRVDFISSPGYLDGSAGARERVGLPVNTGPWAVVTNWALFDFEEKSHHLRLRAIAPFVTLDQVLSEMSFKPLMPPDGKVETLEPPTEEELTLFRTEMDVSGQFTDTAANWVIKDGERWSVVAKEQSKKISPL